MADEPRRSDQQVASAFGALITGIEEAHDAPVPETEETLPADEVDALEVTAEDESVETDAEDLDPEAEAEPSDDTDSAFLTLVVNGEEHPKTQDEAQTLAQKGLYFDQQMNALTAEKREWEQTRQTKEAELMESHREYAEALPIIRQQIQNALGDEPDWVALADGVSPQEFQKVQAHWNQQRGRIAATQAEEQRVNEIRENHQREQIEQWIATEKQTLLEKVPEWRDEAKAGKAREQMRGYLLGLGFETKQLDAIHDHKFFLLVRDALRGREATTVGQKEVQKKSATKASRPGASQQGTSRSARRQRQRERAKAGGGRVEDIAPLMSTLFENEG